jgi:ribonuclease P protein component
MLQKTNRLAKIRDFNLLLKHGRSVSGSFLSLRSLKLSTAQKYFPPKENPAAFQTQLKIAFAVGLKVSKSAVKRNRARRQLREAVRLMLKDGLIGPGWYLLFAAKPDILNRDYAAIAEECSQLVKKAGITGRQ